MVFKDREQKQSLFFFYLILIFHLILSNILVSFHSASSLLCMCDWWIKLCPLLHLIVKRGL